MATTSTSLPPGWGTRQAVAVSEAEAQRREDKRQTQAEIGKLNRPGVREHTKWWELPGGVLLTLYGYQKGGARLRLGMSAVLEDAAAWLKEAQERVVWIIGHAEVGEGSQQSNQSLSLRRANTVWHELSAQGITRAQLFSVGRGGVAGWGDRLSRFSKGDPGYNPETYRMVEVCLMKNTISKVLREHEQSLRNRGYNL